MRILHELSSTDALPDVKGAAGVINIDPASLRRHAPDRHAMMLDERGRLLARCSWWTRGTPPLPGRRVGVIGHYAAGDAAAGTALVDHACARLADAGCTLAVGPMDGNTWRPYRFVIDRGERAERAEHAWRGEQGLRGQCEPEPAFFLEPNNPADWPVHFTAAGFSILATYTSALNEDLSRYDSSLDTAAGRLAERGITIRAFDPAAADAELGRIFTLSLASFSGAYLYTPIEEAEFLEQYRGVLPAVRPELVLLAERQHELVGFLFALPDLREAQRSERVKTIIIKTAAVGPHIARAGLGSLLTAWVEREAHRLGYRRTIHALMHERNASQRISRRSARTIRRYALFARGLSTRAAGA
jgi:GNAT superfamily N-acetyltransferase